MKSGSDVKQFSVGEKRSIAFLKSSRRVRKSDTETRHPIRLAKSIITNKCIPHEIGFRTTHLWYSAMQYTHTAHPFQMTNSILLEFTFGSYKRRTKNDIHRN